MARPKTVDARNSQTRRVTPSAKDAQSGAEKDVRHHEPETADEAQSQPDAPQEGANVAETTQPVAGTAEDAAYGEDKTGGGGTEAGVVAPETGEAGIGTEPAGAQASAPQGETAPVSEASASPAIMETDTALALKRWREHPTCCCGCRGTLASAKKTFLVGHDSRAHSVAKKIARGQMRPEEAPMELILRRKEIGFLVRNPEFGRVMEAWDKLYTTLESKGTE